MKLQGVSLRDLAYVVAVAEHGHFGRAADACHVSQPSLSVGVKKVEDALGYAIFERTSKRALITRHGAPAVERARAVLDAADAMLEAPDPAADPLSGTLVLGAIATVGPYMLRHVLEPLASAHPNLELEIEEGLTDRLLDRLGDGILDAVILSPPIPETGLELEPIYRERFVVAASARSPLARKNRLAASDLDPAEAVLLEEGHCLRDQSLEICGGKRARHRHAAMSLETLKAMVATGTGYSLIPATAVQSRDDYGGLISYLPLSDVTIGRTVSLAWRRSRGRSADVRALLEILRADLPPGAEPV